MAVTNDVVKEITLNNSIKIDGVVVKGQTAHINRENKTITFNEWINDMNLYKNNLAEIRKKVEEFEDFAFQEQEKLLGDE